MTDRSKAIAKAAHWLASTPYEDRPHPLVPHLRREFGLTPLEAVEAMRKADTFMGPDNQNEPPMGGNAA